MQRWMIIFNGWDLVCFVWGTKRTKSFFQTMSFLLSAFIWFYWPCTYSLHGGLIQISLAVRHVKQKSNNLWQALVLLFLRVCVCVCVCVCVFACSQQERKDKQKLVQTFLQNVSLPFKNLLVVQRRSLRMWHFPFIQKFLSDDIAWREGKQMNGTPSREIVCVLCEKWVPFEIQIDFWMCCQ